MATVKETKKRIEDLQIIYNNMIDIQNTILHNEEGAEMAKNVEELCDLNTTLRNLATSTAQFVTNEIKRLENIIDNAVVKID